MHFAKTLFLILAMTGAAVPYLAKAQDSFEPDNTPVQATFLQGFDFLTEGRVVVEQSHTFSSANDVDFTAFATTFNYPTSWNGSEPNTKLFVQVCDGECDGSATLAINLDIYNFDLIANPQTATPVFSLNACPGTVSDELERPLPNFLDDETLFVRVTECTGNGAGRPYRLLLVRDAVGIDLHKISGSVTFMNSASQQVPAPAFVVVSSNYNDFTFADPATGEYAVAVLARDFQSGNEVVDLELTAEVFRNANDFDVFTRVVTGLVAADAQVVDFQLNLFLNGFE